MTDFRDVTAEQRYEQGFTDAVGETRRVWADYAVQGESRIITHVEADDELRGSGAAGRFMQTLADHARAEGQKVTPRCGYAVAWFKRNPDQRDSLG